MTIVTTTTSSGPYAAAAQTTFAVTFQSAGEDEIYVTLNDEIVNPALYTFNRDDDGTGDVVFDDPISGTVGIFSDPEFTQQAAFSSFGAWNPSMLNAPLDRAATRDLALRARLDGVDTLVAAQTEGLAEEAELRAAGDQALTDLIYALPTGGSGAVVPFVYLSDIPGAVADGKMAAGVSVTIGSDIIGSTENPWAADDVGKPIIVGLGTNDPHRSEIVEYLGPGSVRLADVVPATNTGIPSDQRGAMWGTDIGPIIQSAKNNLSAAYGGALVIDGDYFMYTGASTNYGALNGTRVQLMSTGSNAALLIGLDSTEDAIHYANADVIVDGVTFVGCPGSKADARRIISGAACNAIVARCRFLGLATPEASGGSVRFSGSYLLTAENFAGGTMSNNGIDQSVFENDLFQGYADVDSEFLDYGHWRGRLLGKTGIGGTAAWIGVHAPSVVSGGGSYVQQSVVHIRRTRGDEGAVTGLLLIQPGESGRIDSVVVEGIRQNVNSVPFLRGLSVTGVDNFELKDAWFGLTQSNDWIADFTGCTRVRLSNVRTDGGTLNRITVDNVTDLEIADCPEITVIEKPNGDPAAVNYYPRSIDQKPYALKKYGEVSDADFPTPPAVGTKALDRLNKREYQKFLKTEGWMYISMDGGTGEGPELFTNGDFAINDVTPYTNGNNGVASISGGELIVTNSAPTSGGMAWRVIATEIGQTYSLDAAFAGGTSTGLIRVGQNVFQADYLELSGTAADQTFVAETTTTFITFFNAAGGTAEFFKWDNVSLKAI
jgi:hypothetical protein